MAALQEERAAIFRAENKAEKQRQATAEKTSRKEKEEQARLKSYSDIMIDDNMQSNASMNATVDDSSAREFEDDFF